ncbi:MAG TPA: ATP-binding protein [Candidatus Bathyarchaeia archaeon]|nr:ATP-binding protein [Candidatus Bathyarchaeia archaeon]
MSDEKFTFKSEVPVLDLSDGTEMITDFSREAQRHLISARNSLLVLETVQSDKEAIENVFKTFHTISGLADFLKLSDIFWVTKKSELMIDLVRKGILSFEGIVRDLTFASVRRLQDLFELLDEQISGQLKSPYPDQAELVYALHGVTQHPEKPAPSKVARDGKDIPAISVDEPHNFYDHLKEKIQAADGNIILRKEPLERLLDDFKRLDHELKGAQSKVQERQKELIKERELAIKLTQKAQDEARAKSDYLANMSHEIRTLINAILGFTDLIKGDLPPESKQMDHVNTIIVSGKMLLEIVNNILDFSKIEAGKLKLETIPFNLRDVAEEVFQVIRARLDGKPISLYIDINSDVPVNLLGDPTRLKQIFMNLLDNAIKFTEKGEIGLTIHLGRKQGMLNAPALFFSLKDTGIGIPENRKNAVFESFTQAEDSTTRLYGGTGLGLALCKAFVEAMGGSIWIDSQLGVGSEFHFVIQFQKAKDDQIVSAASIDYGGTEKILVVTPFERTVKMFERALDHLSVTPLSICRNMKHAREVLTALNCSPDVIFIDALFDAEQIKSFIKDIRAQKLFRSAKILAVTSDIKFLERSKFQEQIFNGLTFTPIILSEFTAVLQGLHAPSKSASITPQRPVEVFPFKGVKILVVEDSIPNQELLRVHFEDLGCNCDYASNGKEAVECLRSRSYQLCFMDLQMPVMGGLEATSLIRNELKLTLPIVALTAAEVQEERTKCLNVGMSDYLAKPFDVEQLKDKIKKFIT